jgi:hypothetical protein
MSRVAILASFLIRDLFRSFVGIVPLGVALAFGTIAFEYGMDQAQFITVAGIGIGSICLLSTLLLGSRANRASSYLLVAKLHRRTELLAALIVGGLAITTALAILITAGNLLAGRLALDLPSALWILPSWLALWLVAATLALPLSALTSRAGSHVLGYALLAALLVVNDQKIRLQVRGFDWLVRAVTTILWPVSTLLAQASAGLHDRSFFLALAATLGYAVLLLSLADQLLGDKDLLWTE